MTTEIQVDLTGTGAIDVETGDPLSGFQTIPQGYAQLVMAGASPIPLGTQNPTLKQLADSLVTSLPNISTTTIAEKLIAQGFQSNGSSLQFAALGFWVRVYFNAGDAGVHKVEWQSTTMKIDQTTGEIISSTAEPEYIFTTIDKVYATAYGKAWELIDSYTPLAS